MTFPTRNDLADRLAQQAYQAEAEGLELRRQAYEARVAGKPNAEIVALIDATLKKLDESKVLFERASAALG